MIPDKKFGSIFSGGIDSSLQTVLLAQVQKPDNIITLNHVGKDKITENIDKFQKFITNKNVSSLVQSTTESISGNATNLFKHKVFVDNAGILFADGDFSKQIASDFKVMSGDLSQIIDGTTTIGQVVGNTDIKNASTTAIVPHLQKEKNTYKLKVNKTNEVTKHIVGNTVVSVTEKQEVKDSAKIGWRDIFRHFRL